MENEKTSQTEFIQTQADSFIAENMSGITVEDNVTELDPFGDNAQYDAYIAALDQKLDKLREKAQDVKDFYISHQKIMNAKYLNENKRKLLSNANIKINRSMNTLSCNWGTYSPYNSKTLRDKNQTYTKPLKRKKNKLHYTNTMLIKIGKAWEHAVMFECERVLFEIRKTVEKIGKARRIATELQRFMNTRDYEIDEEVNKSKGY